MQRSTRVLVVDDHPGVRLGIASLIDSERPRMHTVGTAATGAEAMAQAFALQPDVVVLDVNLDGEDGLTLIPVLHRAAACEVVVLTSLADPHLALHALNLGARACLHKAAPANELIQAIRAWGRTNDGVFPVTPVNAGVAVSHAVGSKQP